MENTAETGVRRVQASYSDEERARALAVLAANDNNVSRTARQLAIPRSGYDIEIGEGAWLATNVMVAGR